MDPVTADLQRRVENLERNLDESFSAVKGLLDQIKQSLTGSLDESQVGLLSKVRKMEADLKRINSVIAELQTNDADTSNKKAIIGVLGVVALAGLWKIVDFGIWLARHIK